MMMTLCTKTTVMIPGTASHDSELSGYVPNDVASCSGIGAVSVRLRRSASLESPLVSTHRHNAHAQTVGHSPILEVASAKPRFGIGYTQRSTVLFVSSPQTGVGV